MEKNLEKSKELIDILRKELGSATLKEIMDAEDPEVFQLSDTELMERAASAEMFYVKWFKPVLKLFIYTQTKKTVEDNIDPQFGRGTSNGLYIIEQWFKDQVSLSRARLQPKDKPELGESV